MRLTSNVRNLSHDSHDGQLSIPILGKRIGDPGENPRGTPENPIRN
jgi:hypothetical protein